MADLHDLKQQLAAACLQSLDELSKSAEVRFKAGNVPQMEWLDVQVAIIKARMEFRQYLKQEPK